MLCFVSYTMNDICGGVQNKEVTSAINKFACRSAVFTCEIIGVGIWNAIKYCILYC